MSPMKFRKTAAATFAVLALTATAACGGKEGTPSSNAKPSNSSGETPELPTYKVASGVDLEGSDTFDRIKKNGKVTIGVKNDQPYLGFEDPNTGERSGFDIEIAKMIAADLGLSADKITYKTIDSKNRETAISQGQVDYYVGTYTINDERKKKISFAGPYYIAGQSLLVRKDDDSIKSEEDLKGKKVCSISGSTPLMNIQKGNYGAEIVALDKYTDCVKQLTDGQVDAVTTDDAILKGYAAQQPKVLKVVGEPFSDEPYGVGLPKNDKVFQEALLDALQNHMDNGDWKKAYDATLGLSGSPADEPPALERN